MIKYLISFLIILLIYSCKEIKEEIISKKIDKEIKKIGKVLKNEDNINQNQLNKNNNQQEKIFYYLGDPYYIQGVKYIPEENYNYSEIGLSTYYGKELHNVKTVNNDFNKVTELLGRHKTLPIPSMVKITNLENGFSVNIKIVDRHNDNSSLIQVSRKVAQLLGFYKDKFATVRVDILSDASKQWKNVSLMLNEPEFNNTISSAPTDVVSVEEVETNITKEFSSENLNPIEISSEQVKDYKLFLKVLNFNNYSEIQSIISNLTIDVKYTSEKNGSYYDIIIGPLEKKQINNLISYFVSKGYKETKIMLY